MVVVPSRQPEPVFVNLLRSPGIDSQPGGPVLQPYLSNWPTRLQRLAESILHNQVLDSLNVYKYGLRLHTTVELVPWNRILGSLKVLKFWLCTVPTDVAREQ
jgi:hypothetical protein